MANWRSSIWRPLRRCMDLCIGLALLTGAQHARPAEGWTPALDHLADSAAEILLYQDIGGRSDAALYLRPPFDGVYGVVCEPLSRRIGRDLGFALPSALAQHFRTSTRIVDAPATGPGQLILNVTWRDVDPNKFELSVELADLSIGVNRLGGGSVEVSKAELRASELGCLADLTIINRIETAVETMFVHRSANPFSAQIARIEPGQRFRLLGRMPYTQGDWAVVALLDPGDMFSEQIGFATILGLAGEIAPGPVDRGAEGTKPQGLVLATVTEIEVVSGRTTEVCADKMTLKTRVVRRGSRFEQAVRWIPPGETASVEVKAGGALRLSPTCTLRLVRTTRRLDLIAVFEILQ